MSLLIKTVLKFSRNHVVGEDKHKILLMSLALQHVHSIQSGWSSIKHCIT